MVFVGRAILGVSLALALVFALLHPHRARIFSSCRAVLTQPACWLLLLIVSAWIPSLFFSPTPDKSIETLVRTAAVVLFGAYLFAVLRDDEESLTWAIKALVAAAFVFSLTATIHLVFWNQLDLLVTHWGWLERFPQKEYSPAVAAGAVMIPVLIWAASTMEGRWKLGAILTCVLIIILMVKTRNRASFAGLLAGFALFAVLIALHRHRIRHVVLVVGLFLISVSIVLYVLYVKSEGVPVPDHDWPAPTWLIDWHRQFIWSFAWDQGAGHRWLGTGMNAIDKLEGSDLPSLFSANDTNIPFHPHNWLVEVLVETGFVGVTALLVTVGYMTWRMVKTYFQTSSNAMMAAICVWIIYWASGLFNFSFWSVWWQASFLILLALCLCGHANVHDKTRQI